MTIEELLKEPNQELALTKAIAMIVIAHKALESIANPTIGPIVPEYDAIKALKEIKDLK